MAAKKPARLSAARRESKKLRARMGAELCTQETWRSSSLTVEQLGNRECPEDKREMFKQARKWRDENWFVGAVLRMKADCIGFGQSLVAADAKKKNAAADWLSSESQSGRSTHQMVADKYIGTAIDELLLQDNLVSFWMEGQPPYPLETERCHYLDALGREILKFTPGFRAEDLKAAGYSDKQVKRYSSGVITLSEDEGEFFRVLTRGLSGRGFNAPRLKEVFRVCSQNESMEVGESLYAYVGRTVVRMHHLGWEVKQNSGVRQTDAMWDEKRAKGIEKYFKGLQGGLAETTANFDHKTSLLWVDPKNYDAKKWETIISRLVWWAGPLGFMLTARNLNPNFMPLFKAEIKKFRAFIAPHLEHVLNTAMECPVPLKIQWTDECFADMRLLWDMVKTLVQQGPGSLTTAQRFAGLDPDAEADNKLREAEDPKSDKKYLPKYTPGTGNRPNSPGQGRSAGVGDGQGQGPGK